MKKIYSLLASFLSLAIIIFGFLFYKNIDFPRYEKQNSEQQGTPKYILDNEILQILSLGHQNSWADFLWIGFIQYIGNNLYNSNYDYSIQLLQNIIGLSKNFHNAYEWSLWVLPIPQNSNLTYSEKEKINLRKSLSVAEKGMEFLCDQNTIKEINKLSIHSKTWENPTLKNPCQSGMLPYLIAFYGGQLGGNYKLAQTFYTIAGFQEDTPEVSQILAILSSAPRNTPKPIAENFAVMAIGGYDSEPFYCQKISSDILRILKQKSIKKDDILYLQNAQKNIKPPKNTQIQGNTCYEMADRSLKYVYLAFFEEQSKLYTNAKNIEDLLINIPLKSVPNSPSQTDMSLYKKNGNWEYYQKS